MGESSSSELCQALWRVVFGNAAGAEFDTSEANALLASAPSRDNYALAIDETVYTFTKWADDLTKNTACLAGSIFKSLDGQLTVEGTAVLSAAAELLYESDATGESRSPHETCHPWPSDLVAPSADTFQGGLMVEKLNALTIASPPDAPVSEAFARGAADLLARLTSARALQDPKRFTSLIQKRIEQTT